MVEPTRVVKLGEDGKITFSLPGLADQYLLIEESEGQIVISPYDLRWQSPMSSILKLNGKLHYVDSFTGEIPEA